MASKSFVFRFGDVEVQEREFSLTKAGETLSVEPKAFRVLLILLRNPGKLISKEELLNAVWGETAVSENSLTRSITLLRRLLGDEARNPRYIETVATVGYRFVCKVEAAEEPSGAAEAPVEPAVARGADKKAGSPRQMWTWALAGAAALALCLAGAIWYLHRPLPPPRITTYTQITDDGRSKILGGTDGSRLYFTQLSPQTIEQVGVNGGEIAHVPINVPVTNIMVLMDVSQDGSNALVGAIEPGHVADPIWVAPLLGGSAKRLGDDGENEAFSPDGLSVIYGTLAGDIFLTRIDGTENRKLAHVASVAGSFSWSPDRKAIRFTEGGFLWEMSSNGSGLHRLVPDWKEPGGQCCGRWTPDGHFYLFDLASPSSGGQIWALDERSRPFRTRSSAPIRMTTGPVNWGQLIPSRDGTKIFAEGITPRGELSRIDPRTGALQPLLGGISAEFAAFSPDGKSVAYVLFPEGTLWKADQDGTNRIQLAEGPDHIFNPRWSPDSKQILFSTTPDLAHGSIHLVSAVGGKPQRLLPGDGAAHDANWSPDGKQVLFSQGVVVSPNDDLRILDLGSGQVTVVPGSSGMFSPRWSPDGRFILALFADSRRSLPVFDFKTQKWSTVSVNGDVQFPSFSRDGRYIYFLRWGRDQGVIRIPVTGGKEERVIDMSKWHITGFMNFSMTLDPTDAPLVLRDIGSDDIYALAVEEK